MALIRFKEVILVQIRVTKLTTTTIYLKKVLLAKKKNVWKKSRAWFKLKILHPCWRTSLIFKKGRTARAIKTIYIQTI